MRAVGIDFGGERIGVAVGELAFEVASPRPPIQASGKLDHDAEAIADLARREQADCLVLGLPLGAEGEETRMARICRMLGARLEALGWRVEFVDETLTSQESQSAMKQAGLKGSQVKRKVDGESAARVLERFFRGS